MTFFGKLIFASVFALFITTSVFAQSDNNPFLLKRGDNELGVWAGFSPKATTIFGGLRDDEADERKFFIAAFRYGRTLAANDSLALQYTLDAIPVALATGTIVSRTTTGGVTTFQRETAYGGGVTPLGLQLDFANGAKVHPFVTLTVGYSGSTSQCRSKMRASLLLSARPVVAFVFLLLRDVR